MDLSNHLAERLACEEALLAYYFSGSCLTHRNGRLCFCYSQITSDGKRFELAMELSEGYPDIQPDLSISHPRHLPMFGGGLINDLGVSHEFHVLGCDAEGFLKICFTDSWDSGWSAVGVILRGVLWLEGYQEHLRTGRSLNACLMDFQDQATPPAPAPPAASTGPNPARTSPAMLALPAPGELHSDRDSSPSAQPPSQTLPALPAFPQR